MLNLYKIILSQVNETKVYKRRWLILIIFVLYSASNSMQWIQYSIIANIVTMYYNVSTFSVDMTSMIFMITYIPFIFPASFVLDKFVSVVVKFIIKFIWLLFIFSWLQKLKMILLIRIAINFSLSIKTILQFYWEYLSQEMWIGIA